MLRKTPYRHVNGEHFARKMIILIICSAFGPYLIKSFGLKSDHLFIYGLALLTFMGVNVGDVFWRARSLSTFFTLQICFTIWIIFSTMVNDFENKPAGLMVSDLQHCIQPIALIWLVASLTRSHDSNGLERLLKLVCMVTGIAMATNGILALSQLFFDTTRFLGPFLSFDVNIPDLSETPYGSALDVHRYIGIFNLPYENGVGNSIAAITWVYLFGGRKSIPSVSYIILLLIILGGILSLSKVFLYIGIPLSMFCWAITDFKATGGIRLVTFSFLTILLASFVYGSWQGFDNLLMKFEFKDSVAKTLEEWTAGRLGSESSYFRDLFSEALEKSPYYGFGLGSDFFQDIGYLSDFYKAGIVGVLIQLSIILGIGYYAIIAFSRRLSTDLVLLLLSMWLLIVGGNFGSSVLTVNRASVPLWLIICLSVAIVNRSISTSKYSDHRAFSNYPAYPEPVRRQQNG